MKIILVFLMFFLGSCKAQDFSFTNLNKDPESLSSEEWVSWYNQNVKNPKYDTVTVFKVPDYSDLRYIIVMPKGVARVEFSNGKFIGYIDKNRMWIETLTFDKKGKVINGMRPIMITSVDEKGLIVQHEKCIDCDFKINKGSF